MLKYSLPVMLLLTSCNDQEKQKLEKLGHEIKQDVVNEVVEDVDEFLHDIRKDDEKKPD